MFFLGIILLYKVSLIMKKSWEGNQFSFEISELSLLFVLKSATEIQSKRPGKRSVPYWNWQSLGGGVHWHP